MKRTLITAAITAALASSALAAPASTLTPVGTTISNVGVFDYVDDNNATQLVSSTPVVLTVTQVGGVTVLTDGTTTAPGQTVYAAPGSRGVLTYTVQNTGNGPDSAVLTVLNGSGTPLAGVTFFYDTAGTQPVPGTGVPLNAGETRTVYAFYTVPTGTAGGTSTLIDPVGTSTFDTGKTDSNNYGVVVAANVHQATLTVTNNLTSTSPGSATGTHTLTNTGNTPISSGDLTINAALTDSNGIVAATSYQFSSGTNVGASAATPTAALNAYLTSFGNLAAGGTLTLTTTYTTAALKTAGQTAQNDAQAYFTQTGTAADIYGTTSANATTATDYLTVIAGSASVTKTADNCGTDVNCAVPVLGATTGKPGDYIRYTITVKNVGTAALKRPVLRDTLNTNLTYVSAWGGTTQTGVNVKLLWSSSDASPAGTYTVTAPTSLTSGATLYLGQNSTTNTGAPTTADLLNPGETITLQIMTQIK